jgi:DUF4097 and DUF4098 domain-containing protein YvlB
MRKISLALILGLALGGGLVTMDATDAATPGARQSVDETRHASRHADIEVYNVAGSVRVIGWDRAEVQVTGTLGRGTEGLEFDSDEDDVYIEVEVPSGGRRGEQQFDQVYGSDLEIRVPERANVEIDSLSASVEVIGVDGEITITTVRGGVIVDGSPRELNVNTGSGDVVVDAGAGAREIDLISGSGSVELYAEGSEVSVETVGGDITVVGLGLLDTSLGSTAGSIHFTGDLVGTNDYDFESFHGGITVILPADVSAVIDASSFAGGIQNDFGFEPRSSERGKVGKRLDFEVGGGEADVFIKTFSGSIEIRKS